MEKNVLHVGSDHGQSVLSEDLVVFDFSRLARGVVGSHSGIDLVARLGLKCEVKDVQIEAILYGVSAILPAQSLTDVIKILEWERKFLSFADLLGELDQVSGGLQEHDRVLTFISWHR